MSARRFRCCGLAPAVANLAGVETMINDNEKSQTSPNYWPVREHVDRFVDRH
jgi:hypothetical protein